MKQNIRLIVSKQTNKEQIIIRPKFFMYNPSSKQSEKFDEVICSVWKNLENIDMFEKDFYSTWIFNMDFGSRIITLFLHSF